MSAERKRAERERRQSAGEVEFGCWLSASDHAALTQMAREARMTQGQVVSRLIGMRAAVLGLERFEMELHGPHQHWIREYSDPDGDFIRHSDLTAAIGLPDPVLDPLKAGDKVQLGAGMTGELVCVNGENTWVSVDHGGHVIWPLSDLERIA